jgi:putative cofactor-binding repeat protein
MWNKYGKNSIKLGRLPDIFTQYGTMKIGIIADVLESAVNGNTIRYIIVRQAHDTKTNLNDCVKFLEQKKLLAGSREDAINSSQL